MSELKQQLEMRLPDDPFTYEELQALVGLLAAMALQARSASEWVHSDRIHSLALRACIPERFYPYAADVGQTVRSHLQQIARVHEAAMLAGLPLESSL